MNQKVNEKEHTEQRIRNQKTEMVKTTENK